MYKRLANKHVLPPGILSLRCSVHGRTLTRTLTHSLSAGKEAVCTCEVCVCVCRVYVVKSANNKRCGIKDMKGNNSLTTYFTFFPSHFPLIRLKDNKNSCISISNSNNNNADGGIHITALCS